ncbi:hypothetical protein [Streptomyces sp. SJL17-1]|uniref:hypothetical protein n=1 Tax=Streptomyces sp. SJL17-1 TaxID=2967223 RepID=UPI0029672B87|nr:hypothetical protein [Streptomyces sp. SJL17-1]
MPGQRKRKRQRQQGFAELSREGDRFGPDAGRWELRYTTKDESEWRAELRRLRTEEPGLDRDAVRLDTLCGRSTHPTTYRLSVFVAHPTPEQP